MNVAVGQVWRHVPSGDVRTVLAVLTYRDRTGFEPTERDLAHGMTHIAAMAMDRRDSSDMKLVEGRPAYPSSWELLSHWCERRPEPRLLTWIEHLRRARGKERCGICGESIKNEGCWLQTSNDGRTWWAHVECCDSTGKPEVFDPERQRLEDLAREITAKNRKERTPPPGEG